VGTLGRHLVTARNINQVPYLTAFSAGAQDPSKYGGAIPAVEPDLPTAYSQAGFNYAGDLAFDAPLLVPYKGYGTMSTTNSMAPQTTTRCKSHCSGVSARV
jgi:hypothetical protein